MKRDITVLAEETLINIIENPALDVEIQRHALESLANCSRGSVTGIITDAYASKDDNLRMSAIVAMGRTCDTNRWSKQVLEELSSSDPDMRREAARAAGELQIEEAIHPLTKILAEDDREAQEVAVWALGEVGGKEAVRILQNAADIAEENQDDEMLALIDDAMGNASLAMGDLMFGDYGV